MGDALSVLLSCLQFLFHFAHCIVGLQCSDSVLLLFTQTDEKNLRRAATAASYSVERESNGGIQCLGLDPCISKRIV